MEKEKIISICCSPKYVNLTPNQIVAELASEGTYIASESSFYRVLREEKLLKHRLKSKAPSEKRKPTEKIATAPNQVYSWDITYLSTDIKGIHYYLYLVLDIWSRYIVGWSVHESENQDYAVQLLENTVKSNNAKNVNIHSDNGSPMRNGKVDVLFEKLGISKTHSRPGVSTDNPYSESCFKTLKYQTNYPGIFKKMEEAINWVGSFVNWYNHDHMHSGIKYVRPYERHTNKDVEILKRRKETYEEARKRHPERWSKRIRNWDKVTVVKLNSVKNNTEKFNNT